MRTNGILGGYVARGAVVLVCTFAGPLFAQQGDVGPLVFPAVASASGVSGEWRTQLVVSNPNDLTVTLRVDFVRRGPTPGSGLYRVQLEPNRTVVFDDVVGDTLDMPGMSGALTVSASLIATGTKVPLAARARVYNVTPNGVYGQGSVAQQANLFAEADAADLIGLVTNGERYTNLALARPYGSHSSIVLVDLLGMNGAVLATESLALEGAAFFTNVRSSLFGREEPDEFSIRVRQSIGTIPCVLASVVERATGDATTVEPVLRTAEEEPE